MQIKSIALAIATAFAAVGAQAAIDLSTAASQGNSSVLFVAIDVNSNAGFVADLGVNMSDFTNSTALFAADTLTTWNFSNDTTTLSTTGNSWSAEWAEFYAAQAGGDLLWAVIAGDAITGTTVTSSNAIAGRGMLATGNATQTQMLAASTSAPTGNALANVSTFYSSLTNATNGPAGTLASANNGALYTTQDSGSSWLPAVMGSNFNGQLTWSYLLANGESSTFQWQQQVVANPVVVQFGIDGANSTDSLNTSPVMFSFDVDSGTLILSAVPEPGTYALLAAGLVAVAAAARRRQA